MVKGIDTSEHQAGAVDYAKAKAAGYDFVILRIGYNTRMDKMFESDYARAKASGLKVGVYFYPTTTSEAGAVEDAKRVINWLVGKFVDMPVVYDMEEKSMNVASRKYANADQYNAWSRTLAEAGYKSMLYTGEYMFKGCFDGDAITDPLWIAKYSTKAPSIGKDYVMWQYTSNAYPTDFYTKNLDRSYCYDESIFTGTTVTENTTSTTSSTTSTTSSTTSTGGTYMFEVSTVKNGSQGSDVKLLQRLLKGTGASITADGIFGAKTLSAVQNFQRSNGLSVDGIVGNNTWKALLCK